MSGPILEVLNAGYGVTPPCPEAKFKPADMVRLRRLKHLKHLPEEGAVFIVVPAGFPAEYAMADAQQKPRPLMITGPLRCISYIIGFEGSPKPHQIRERDLLASNKPPATIGWSDAGEEA